MSHPASARANGNTSARWYFMATTYAGGSRSVQLDGDQLRDTRLLHGNAVQAVGDLHGFAVVGDDDELGVLLHAAQHLDEPADIGVVEGGVNLVEQAERARLVLEHAEHQRDGGQRLLAAREQLDALKALAGRLGDDLDPALERIGLVEQRQAGAAAAEERAEGFLKVAVDRGERLVEAVAPRLSDASYPSGRLHDRLDEILALFGDERMTAFELVELLDGHHVHRPKSIDLGAQRRDRFLGAEGSLFGKGDGVDDFALFVLPLLRRDDGRVGKRLAFALERVDLLHDLIERRVHGVFAGERQMREIGFRGRARDVEL